MNTHHYQPAPTRWPLLLLGLAGWAAGLLLTISTLLLAGPSTELYLAVQNTGISGPNRLATYLIVAIATAFVLVLWRHVRRHSTRVATGLAAGISTVVAYGCSEVLKFLLAAERPCRAVLPDPSCPGAGSWSFPSNHATVAFALATALVLITSRWWALGAYFAAVVVAAARVVEGVHFPHDVLAGAILGTCTTLAGAVVLNDLVARIIARLSRHRRST